MKVILRQSVENLGGPGDVVTVKDGYARNFLIPMHYALPHTPGNLKQVVQEENRLTAKESRVKGEADELAARFAGMSLHFVKRVGEEGVLYGSVTPAEIADALERKGLTIDKRHLLIAEPIKQVGEHNVYARLHPEVDLEVLVTVAPEGEETGTFEPAAQSGDGAAAGEQEAASGWEDAVAEQPGTGESPPAEAGTDGEDEEDEKAEA